MDKLLTQKDLAEKWQVDVATITKYRNEGVITPCKGIPAIRFSRQHIAELEGVRLEQFSPIERRKLELEIEKLREENELLKEYARNIFQQSTLVVGMLTEKKD
ncbi:helix-turn-helix domain-containing protein [Alkaliphilus sp. B6464]|uniref:helix-turn-helix domain-containing protein n=1 Tax=Alkaliphilus sp. B6464 TaxID=2731219 RepID=UPI001BAD3340|nr:helix-turn-helix domain-containing protein [Alkaliphilus sp. B6464]QUH20919.1 helix-turn-helix domain-containing protein [Alkaliphilus sp. B6464]